MEFPDLGKNCNTKDCNTLDYLPILCECGKTFCKECFMEHAVHCGNSDNILTELPGKSLDKIYKCSFEKCAVSTLHYFPCIKCGKHFCISHRYHKQCEISEEEIQQQKIRLNAPQKQFNEAKKTVDQEIAANIEKAKRNPRNSKTASKLSKMLLKGKAKGLESIPVADRVYCLVYLPTDSDPKPVAASQEEAAFALQNCYPNIIIKSQAIYISKQWTLGKVIDSISSICKVSNNNNKADANKLRLFKHGTGAIVHKEMGTSLKDLCQQEIVYDGDTVILEYISVNDLNLQNIYLKHFNTYV